MAMRGVQAVGTVAAVILAGCSNAPEADMAASSGDQAASTPTMKVPETGPRAWLRARRGRYCIINFRADVLGVTRRDPLNPSGSKIDGADDDIAGTLTYVDDIGVAIEDSRQRGHWIPHNVIVSIEFPPSRANGQSW